MQPRSFAQSLLPYPSMESWRSLPLPYGRRREGATGPNNVSLLIPPACRSVCLMTFVFRFSRFSGMLPSSKLSTGGLPLLVSQGDPLTAFSGTGLEGNATACATDEGGSGSNRVAWLVFRPASFFAHPLSSGLRHTDNSTRVHSIRLAGEWSRHHGRVGGQVQELTSLVRSSAPRHARPISPPLLPPHLPTLPLLGLHRGQYQPWHSPRSCSSRLG